MHEVFVRERVKVLTRASVGLHLHMVEYDTVFVLAEGLHYSRGRSSR